MESEANMSSLRDCRLLYEMTMNENLVFSVDNEKL